jgi:O-acetyl-ADP-ribose deacetylase (regulator of RNase III)
MGVYREVEGDLISMAKLGMFDVITHGCNCMCNMKSGIAPQMADAFGVDKFFLENENTRGDINKLGQIDYETRYQELEKFGGKWVKYPDELEFLNGKFLTIVNSYTQYIPSRITKPLDYEALTLCMRKINHMFKGKKIGLPKIGAGLAGGVWDVSSLPLNEQITALPKGQNKDIKTIILDELKDCNVTVVLYKP